MVPTGWMCVWGGGVLLSTRGCVCVGGDVIESELVLVPDNHGMVPAVGMCAWSVCVIERAVGSPS